MPGSDKSLVLQTDAYGHGNLRGDPPSMLIGNALRGRGLEVANAAGSASCVASELLQTPSVLIRELGPQTMLSWVAETASTTRGIAVALRWLAHWRLPLECGVFRSLISEARGHFPGD